MECCNGNMRDMVGIHSLRVQVRNDWVLEHFGNSVVVQVVGST